jgi:hypothetical protein
LDSASVSSVFGLSENSQPLRISTSPLPKLLGWRAGWAGSTRCALAPSIPRIANYPNIAIAVVVCLTHASPLYVAGLSFRSASEIKLVLSLATSHRDELERGTRRGLGRSRAHSHNDSEFIY